MEGSREVSAPTYTVQIPVFEGPFDLLLQLIEREKLDISAVSLATVTDQFVAHMARLQDSITAAELADFLVIAARLILIKSRLLLPRLSRPEEEQEEDPAEALARQLREYRRFKQAAMTLGAIEDSGLHSFLRVALPPDLERHLGVGDLSLGDLLAAVRVALAQMPEDLPSSPGLVVPFTLTIHDQIRLIGRVTAGGKPVMFRELVTGATHRLEIIVTLLAVLELIKRRQVTVSQGSLFGEISIVPVPGVEITDEEMDNGNLDLNV
jgi:segregation and condensation protein A